MKNIYIIGDVLDNNTNKRSEKFGYRIGRKCEINLQDMVEGMPLIVYYPDTNRSFVTSIIKDVEENDYGLWITTKNRQYRFNNTYETKDGDVQNVLNFWF